MIRVIEEFNSRTKKVYSIYFLVNNNINEPGKVYKATIEYNQETVQTKFTIKRFVMVMEDNKYVNVELESEGDQQAHTNIAYGYE